MISSLSLSRLFVLGVLSNGPSHGYDLVTTAERWAVHRWAGLTIGAIYHTVKKLGAEGLVQQVKVERSQSRPERQIWQISEAGQKALLGYVRAGLSSLDFESREVDMALAFAHLISPDERQELLARRLAPIEERRKQLEYFNAGYANCLEDSEELAEFRRLRLNHPWIYAGIRHGLERIRIEEAWTRDLIQEIASWPTRPFVEASHS